MKMKIPFSLSAAILAVISTVGSDAAATIEDENADATRMVLGSKLDNPYTVNSMEDAALLVKSGDEHLDGGLKPFHRRGRATVSITATHKYVKLTPRTEADHIFLQDLDDNTDDDIVLHEYPLDVEVLQEGDYYVEADVNEVTNYSPVYGVLPIKYKLPDSLLVEVLDRLHEPADDDSEDEMELAALDSSGLDPDSPFPTKNLHRERRKLRFGSRYRPQGCVYVWDTSIDSWSPLRQAKISIGRLVWWRYTHTDNNGCFVSPKKYRGTVSIRANWRSNVATIRKSWNEMLGIAVSNGLMTIRKSDNYKKKYIRISDDHLWMKGTVHNGLILYNDYAAAEGISRLVNNANVWVWANGDETASAPMLKKFPALPTMASIAGFTQSNFWVALFNGAFSLLIVLVPPHLRPDFIFSGISGYKDTRRIHQLVFHEAGHYSHASQAGSWYWSKLFAAEVSNGFFYGGSYGDGTKPSQSAADHIALVEGWATLTEVRIMRAHYNGVFTSTFSGPWKSNADYYLDGFDMNRVPMTRTRRKDDGWFLHGLFYDCIDENESARGRYIEGDDATPGYINHIDDNVYVYDSRELYPIFRYLTSGVYDACDFGNNFVRGYAYDSQDIIDLFESYGFDCIN